MIEIPPQVQRIICEMDLCASMSLLGNDVLIWDEWVAVILATSSRTVGKRRHAYRLPKAIRLGRLVRWRLSDMRAWIKVKYDLPAEAMSIRDVPMRPIDGEPFTIEHLAIFLHCSVRTIRKLLKAGRLPRPYRSHPTLWRRANIRAWVLGGCRPCGI